jgi:hypothetical protein
MTAEVIGCDFFGAAWGSQIAVNNALLTVNQCWPAGQENAPVAGSRPQNPR